MADEVLKRDENYIPVAGGLTNDANLEIKALRVDPTSKRLLTNDSGTTKSSYGTHTALTITNLNSLASSQTAGWQSIRISNLTNLAVDYEIAIKLTMADTAPANDKAVYVYISLLPWWQLFCNAKQLCQRHIPWWVEEQCWWQGCLGFPSHDRKVLLFTSIAIFVFTLAYSLWLWLNTITQTLAVYVW